MANTWNGPVRPSAMKKLKPGGAISGLFPSRTPTPPATGGIAGQLQMRTLAKSQRTATLPKKKGR